jgi:hypothetical protein
MSTSEARILHITIHVPMAEAYDFAHRPENFPLWAAGLADSLRQTDRGWIATTPDGEASIRFSAPNDHGVLDHVVEVAGRPAISVPLRMVPNGDGTEVELMLFRQPDMTEAAFKRDARAVRSDLEALKLLLETRAARSRSGRA